MMLHHEHEKGVFINVIFGTNDKKLALSFYFMNTLPLEENWVFVTNQFATSYDYLTFTTIVGYIYNYFLHLVLLATTL